MSEEPRRFHPEKPARTKSARRTRVLVAGVFAGAIAAMSLSWLLGWGFETEQERTEARAEAAAQARHQAFSSPPGTCLTWRAADAGDIRTVDCSEPHLFEVIGAVDISAEYPRGAQQPDAETWRTLTTQRCGQQAREYLDGPLDPEGKLNLGLLQPDDQQWDSGDRRLHCGLQRTAPGGSLQTLEKPAADIDQSDVWEKGTCLGIEDKSPSDPVDCTERHSYEMVAVVDLGEKFEAFPSEQDQNTFLDKRCNKLAGDYSGDADLRKQGLITAWDTLGKKSWQAGSTRVNCKVGALLEDDSGLASIRGSVSKDAASTPRPSQGSGENSGNSGSGNGDSGSDNGDSGNGNGSGNDGDSGNGGSGNAGSSGDTGSAGNGDGNGG
ncbi:septum formation family protein [Prauserella halophila]|uniref:Septum formation family protein n=1 Tax=Prauserella halophila TaxID=185641 RepID=A0ABN1WL00_9PSEU|nr:septum formation family protein [Prauserella halophila]